MTDKKQFLQRKIEENLYEFFAKDMKNARDSELYMAIAKTLRLMIGKNWFESVQRIKKDKTLYILSFEYSLGTRLTSNSLKLDVLDELKEILADNGKDFDKIVDQELESALGFGDLGLMSAAMLDTLTNLDQNVYAYGLRYRKGMLKQLIVNGEQVEEPDDWKNYKNPWEHEKGFYHEINVSGTDIKAIPYDYPIVGNKNDNINTLRLWKSESTNDIDFKHFSEGKIQQSYTEINKANSIVEFIYPQEDSYEGRKLRLSQEYFFASASMMDLLKKYRKYFGDDFKHFPDKVLIQINDIHPILSQVVFIDVLVNKYDISFDEAVSICKESFVFLNASLIHEAFEKWDITLFKEVCPELFPTVEKLNSLLDEELKASKLAYVSYDTLSIIRYDFVEMINLAFYLSKKVYVPTAQHRKVLEMIYLPHHCMYYDEKIEVLDLGLDTIDYLEITNKNLYTCILDHGCVQDNDEVTPELIDKLFELKQEKKKKLLEYLGDKAKDININSVFDMNLGVIHEYKRQLLCALSIALTYYKLKRNSSLDITPRTYFFGGKSYPNYYFAKEIIKFINALAYMINNDFSIKDKIKIVFIEDYNVNKSNMLIPAADIYESLSVVTKGTVDLENFKYMINGAVSIFSATSIGNAYIKESGEEAGYIFEPNEDDAINRELSNRDYYVYEYINNNRIIKNMIDYYSYLPYNIFPYNFHNIIDNILKYNDGYFVIKDLLSHYEVHEKAMKDYRDRSLWTTKRISHIKYAKTHEMNEAVKNNLLNYWR